MAAPRKKTRDMTQGVIWKHLLAFALPLMVGNLFQQLYNTVDSIVVGQFVSQGTHKQVRDAASETGPGTVAKCTDDGLYDDSCQRRQNPEVTQVVRVCSKGGEDTADVGTLQGVGNLYAKESETDVPQFPKA